VLYLRIRRKELKIRSYLCRLPSAVNVMLNLSSDEARTLCSFNTVYYTHQYGGSLKFDRIFGQHFTAGNDTDLGLGMRVSFEGGHKVYTASDIRAN